MSRPGLKASKNLVYRPTLEIFCMAPVGVESTFEICPTATTSSINILSFLATEAECYLVYHIQRDFLPESLYPNP